MFPVDGTYAVQEAAPYTETLSLIFPLHFIEGRGNFFSQAFPYGQTHRLDHFTKGTMPHPKSETNAVETVTMSQVPVKE